MRLSISRSQVRISDVVEVILIQSLILILLIALYRDAFVVFSLVFARRSFVSVLLMAACFNLRPLHCFSSDCCREITSCSR